MALTQDSLIESALEGNDRAIAAYDEMLWKIRADYVVVLYGSLTLMLGVGEKAKASVAPDRAGLVAVLLITGFTLCAAALDYAFLASKQRELQAKEELVAVADGESADWWTGKPLQALLHDSGESRARIDWRVRAPLWPIALFWIRK